MAIRRFAPPPHPIPSMGRCLWMGPWVCRSGINAILRCTPCDGGGDHYQAIFQAWGCKKGNNRKYTTLLKKQRTAGTTQQQ